MTLVCTCLTAITINSIAAVLAYMKSRDNENAIKEQKVAIQHLDIKVDGRLTQLLESTSKQQRAEGELAGAITERAAVAAAASAVVSPDDAVVTAVQVTPVDSRTVRLTPIENVVGPDKTNAGDTTKPNIHYTAGPGDGG